VLTSIPVLQRIDTIHRLDLQYHDAIHQSAMIAQDEEQRKLRLRIITLKDDKAILGDQLAESKNRIKSISQECDSLRAELKLARSGTQTQVRAQTREMAKLKVTQLRMHIYPGLTSDLHQRPSCNPWTRCPRTPPSC